MISLNYQDIEKIRKTKDKDGKFLHTVMMEQFDSLDITPNQALYEQINDEKIYYNYCLSDEENPLNPKMRLEFTYFKPTKDDPRAQIIIDPIFFGSPLRKKGYAKQILNSMIAYGQIIHDHMDVILHDVANSSWKNHLLEKGHRLIDTNDNILLTHLL